MNDPVQIASDLRAIAVLLSDLLKLRNTPGKGDDPGIEIAQVVDALGDLADLSAQAIRITAGSLDRILDQTTRLVALIEDLTERVAELEARQDTGGEGE